MTLREIHLALEAMRRRQAEDIRARMAAAWLTGALGIPAHHAPNKFPALDDVLPSVPLSEAEQLRRDRAAIRALVTGQPVRL